MTFSAQAIPFRRQRHGWQYRSTRDGVESRHTISVVLYPDGEVLADAIPAQGDAGTFTFRATVERRSTFTGKVEYCLVFNSIHVYASRRLTDLLEYAGNQAICAAYAAADERRVKARAAREPLVSWCASCRAGTCGAHKADCPECVAWKGVGPSHEPARLCRSGKRPHCSCNACY